MHKYINIIYIKYIKLQNIKSINHQSQYEWTNIHNLNIIFYYKLAAYTFSK